MDRLYARYSSLIPDFEIFMEYIRRPLVQSLRINTLKAARQEILPLLHDVQLRHLDFYADGFSVEGKHSLGNHMTHNLGLIYVQEIASMTPALVLDPQPGETVMDLCAAPGSKTTQLAQLMANRGLLVVNEISRKRMRGLIHNIKRCGLLNEVVVCMNGQKMDRVFTDYFDRILIDAPCSAEGTIRRSRAVLYHWGIRNIQRMSRLQIGLVISAFRALRPGGTMVYSTCTIAPEENEKVISYLLDKCPQAEVLPVELDGFKTRPGVTEWQGSSYDERMVHCARILPQDNDTAPFFIARLTKQGTMKERIDYSSRIELNHALLDGFARKFGVDQRFLESYAIFKSHEDNYISTPEAFSFRGIRPLRKGLEFAKIYGQEIKPDNDAVQLFGLHATRNVVDLTKYQVNKFLRGEILKVGMLPDIDKGFIIMRFGNIPIGTGKYNGKEIRSAVKRERRIP
jgi:NOL1/NOP2/sun family putative RNA methylase